MYRQVSAAAPRALVAAIGNEQSPICGAAAATMRAKTRKQGRLLIRPKATFAASLRFPWAAMEIARVALVVGKAATAPPSTGPAAWLASVAPSTADQGGRMQATDQRVILDPHGNSS